MLPLSYILKSESRQGSSLISFVLAAILFGLFSWPVSEGFAAASSQSEYELKVAILYKLSRFVQWPKTGGEKPKRVNFCVFKNDPFSYFMTALQGQYVSQREIKVRYLANDGSGLSRCQLVFIGKSLNDAVWPPLQPILSNSTLTISDANSFAEKGGMIQITRRNKRLGFVVNMKAVNQSGIHLASPFLQMATLIHKERQ